MDAVYILLIPLGIVIALIIWAEVVIRRGQSQKAAFPLKWFYFYTYFLLPIWAIGNVFQIITREETVTPIEAFAGVVWVILIVVIGIGLHKRKLWGWYLNWVLLAVGTLFSALRAAEHTQGKILIFVFTLLFIGYIFTLQNVVYFWRRKVIFT